MWVFKILDVDLVGILREKECYFVDYLSIFFEL